MDVSYHIYMRMRSSSYLFLFSHTRDATDCYNDREQVTARTVVRRC